MTRPRRPLRSVFLGNLRYLSAYAIGVSQAMGALGHWHRTVSIHDQPEEIERQVAEMSPDLIWTHMVLWPPRGAAALDSLTEILARWKSRGACVFLHDGDPRERVIETDVARAFSIALVNRSIESRPWPIPCVRWPYAALAQREIATAHPAWSCDLLFAGILRLDALYGARTALVEELRHRLGSRMRVVSPGSGDVNNRMLVADAAPSATAVLGLARPEVPGWVDTRVFQYPGAGGVLIHDDAGEFLEPDEHYLRFDRLDPVESVLHCLERARTEGPGIRERVFRHIQAHHTWANRCEDALAAFYGR